jgi:hypothetical protein
MKNLKVRDSKFGIFVPLKIDNYVWHRRRRVGFILFIVLMLLVQIRCQKWHVLW